MAVAIWNDPVWILEDCSYSAVRGVVSGGESCIPHKIVLLVPQLQQSAKYIFCCHVEASLGVDDPPSGFTSDLTGFSNGSSPSISLIVHCEVHGWDFLNCMALSWPPSPPSWISHWSVSVLNMRWSHFLRLSRKRAVINPERLDMWKIRQSYRENGAQELTVGNKAPGLTLKVSRMCLENKKAGKIRDSESITRKRYENLNTEWDIVIIVVSLFSF